MTAMSIRKRPPPPHLPVKNVLCCLFLILFLALPVQSQTAVPTAPAQLTNPTVMAPCGLPASWAGFTSSATFNMTSDCVFNSWSVQPGSVFLFFSSGTFTINGNGYSIIGPSNGSAIYAQSANTTLNLNNVIIRQAGSPNIETVLIREGARLNARNVLFRDNTSDHVLHLRDNSQASLENVWFLNNRNTANSVTNGSALTLSGGFTGNPTVRITNAIFQGNSGADGVVVKDVSSTLEFNGCLTFSGNLRADGVTAAYTFSTTGTTDSNTGACPAAGFSYWLALTPAPTSESRNQPKKRKEATPAATATSTSRPQIAATHVALQAATGATFGATYGLDSGVHFRQLDGAGIGVQSIIDAGFLEAFDVWGYVEQGVEVCFPQIGRVIFLDASASPRAIVPLESTVTNGQTCVSIDSPGSLVLLPN